MNNIDLFRNNVNAARARLNAGANVNRRFQSGYTPLIYAAMMGRTDMVRLFINQGAHVNARDSHDITALMYASMNGYFEIVRMLVEAGARINHRASNGTTALGFAVTYNHPLIARYLIQHGAVPDVNFNWNSRGNLIPMPNKLRNNKNAFTANRFKFGVPYVQVKTPTGKFYYSKAGFKKWYESKRTDPLTKAKLSGKNLKIVRFEVPKNIQNKAQTMRRQRAARTIARTLRRR
jgi:Ankyrin repeats (3 copies)